MDLSAYRVAVDEVANATKFNNMLAALEAAVGSALTRSPMETAFGAVGDGATDDHTALQACADALVSGGIMDLGGKTYYTSVPISFNTTFVLVMNGKLLGAGNRVAIITAADVTFFRVRSERTTAASGATAADELSCVVVGAARFTSLFSDYTITGSTSGGALACLLIGNGLGNYSRIIGGNMASTSRRQNACAIYVASGASANIGIIVDGVNVTGGCTDGILFFDSQDCRVVNCHVGNMTNPANITSFGTWVNVAGDVYRTVDRTDGSTSALVEQALGQLTVDAVGTLTPAAGHFSLVTIGSTYYVYANIGSALVPGSGGHSMTSKITGGYGILFYATAVDVRDNLAAHNHIYDVDGFGIYYAVNAGGDNNGTAHNTIRNSCRSGAQNQSLPYAGIAFNGGTDYSQVGDHVDTTTGSTPGVFAANGATGISENVTVRDAEGLANFYSTTAWHFRGCRSLSASNNGFIGTAGSGTIFESCYDDNTLLTDRIVGGLQINSRGASSPNTVVTADPGSTFLRTTGGGATTTLCIKHTTTDAANWTG